MTKIATTKTRAGGAWSYKVKPSISTTYQARLGATISRNLTIGVKPAVTVSQLGDGTIWTHIAARPLVPGPVGRAAEASGGRLGDGLEGHAERDLERHLPGACRRGDRDGPHRLQRQPGGCRLPRRQQQSAALPRPARDPDSRPRPRCSTETGSRFRAGSPVTRRVRSSRCSPGNTATPRRRRRRSCSRGPAASGTRATSRRSAPPTRRAGAGTRASSRWSPSSPQSPSTS